MQLLRAWCSHRNLLDFIWWNTRNGGIIYLKLHIVLTLFNFVAVFFEAVIILVLFVSISLFIIFWSNLDELKKTSWFWWQIFCRMFSWKTWFFSKISPLLQNQFVKKIKIPLSLHLFVHEANTHNYPLSILIPNIRSIRGFGECTITSIIWDTPYNQCFYFH